MGFSAPTGSLADARPLTMHWDGTAWNLVSAPIPADATDAYLFSVGMSSHNNAWAAGTYKTSDGLYHGFALHWNGQQWVLTPGYSGSGAQFTELSDVAVTSLGDVWAVGWDSPTLPPFLDGPPQAYPGAETVILRWSNGAWHRVDSPSPGAGSQLVGLTTFANRAWAVGDFVPEDGSPTQTLIEHYGPHLAPSSADNGFSQ